MTDFKIKMATLAKKYNISHKRDIDWHNFVAEVEQLTRPELAESKDERIRRELVAFFSELQNTWHEIYWHDLEVANVLAYLEKKKENPKTTDSIPSDCTSDAKCGNSQHKVGDFLEGRKLADEVVAYLIKSGYQPIIKDTLDQKHFQIKIPRHKEDFFQSKEYKHCREILDEYYYEGDFAGDVYTLYVLKQKEQKPAEWIEEDEKKMIFLERLIEHNVPDGQYGWVDGRKGGFVTKSEAISMLKSLRPRPKQEWSEEDERLINTTISFLKDFADKGYENAVECIDWLKSLRPSWKPTEEQMEALQRASTNKYLSAKQFDILVSLCEDLEKL